MLTVISGHSLEEHKCLFIFYTHVVYILYYIQYGEKARVESMCLKKKSCLLSGFLNERVRPKWICFQKLVVKSSNSQRQCRGNEINPTQSVPAQRRGLLVE